MGFLGNLGGGLFSNPIVGLVVFVAVSIGAIWVLSGGQLMQALGGILRLVLTFFTTPFAFLRDALSIVRNSGEAEQDYVRTRTFMLFRYSRLQYLSILLISLLVLSAGVTTALMSLWPSEQIALSRAMGEQVSQLREQVTVATQAATTASSPEQRQTLQTQRDEAQAAYQAQQQSVSQLLQSNVYNHQLISQIANTRNAGSIANVRDQIDNYVRDCPRGYYWSGFSLADCQQFRNYVVELSNRRINELNAARTAEEAERAFNEADSAAQAAEQNLAAARQSLELAQQQQRDVSLFNPDWIAGRIIGLFSTLIATALIVIAIVWFGAILIDVLNWIILMMRAAEKNATAKLDNAGAEYR